MRTCATVVVVISVLHSSNFWKIISTNADVEVGLNSSFPKTEQPSLHNVTLSERLGQHFSRIMYRHSSRTTQNNASLSPVVLNTKKLSSQEEKYPNLKPIPDDLDSFKDIQMEGKVFVDKTHIIRRLYECGNKFLLLARPRGFGKSVFAQMLREYFNGSTQYFEQTAIHNRGNKMEEDGTWVQHPIIYIDFSEIAAETDELLQRKLWKHLLEVTESYGLNKESFLDITGLIKDLHQKYKLPVYVVIDEYDQPFSTCSNKKECEAITKSLSAFYAGIKSLDWCIGFMFVTGVSRLGLDVDGCGIKDYKDITFDERFSSAFGFTLEEVDTYFQPHISKFADDEGLDYEDIKAMIFQWYGGYLFAIKNGTNVLNSLSTCSCLRHQIFERYWVVMDRMKAVITAMKRLKTKMWNFQNLVTPEENLQERHPSLSETPLAVTMQNHGCITIKCPSTDHVVIFDYPNIEVKVSLRALLLENPVLPLNNQLTRDALMHDDIESFIGCLNTYGFPMYNPPTDLDVLNEHAIIRAITAVLNASEIKYKDNLRITEIDIDIVITSVTPKYIIEVRAGKNGAITAISQLICYAVEDESSLRKAIHPDEDARFVGVNVKRTKTGKRNIITEWISVPYRARKIWMYDMKASNSSKFYKILHSRRSESNFMRASKLVWD